MDEAPRRHPVWRVLPKLLGLGATYAAPIAIRSLWARSVADRRVGHPLELDTTAGALAVSDRMWRGPAPGPGGYAELAAGGVGLVIDLREEADVEACRAAAIAAGLEYRHLQIANGGPVLRQHVEAVSDALQQLPVTSYVHCEAGEGRTGAMVGALEVLGGRSRVAAMSDALAVGSLTLAQLVCVATGGAANRSARIIDRLIDQPSERLFDLVR